MEAHDDGSRIGGDWFALKFKARFLTVAAVAVGIGFASPSVAQSPKAFDQVIKRTPAAAKAYAQLQLHKYGWNSPYQWKCLVTVWTNESNWRPQSFNKIPVRVKVNGKIIKYHAGGIPQILGLSPKVKVSTQVNLGLKYIHARYGSPCAALRFWNRHYWY
jgi:hypothetical protein